MTPNEKFENNKIKKKTKLSLLRLVFFTIVFVLIIRASWSLFVKHPKTEFAKYGNLELSESVTGYIFKNETVIQAPISGEFKINIPEGTKVKKGVNVATIINNKDNVELEQKVQKINDELTKANGNQNNIFENDSKKLDENLKNELQEVFKLSKAGDLESLEAKKNSINGIISKKVSISGEKLKGTSIEGKVKERDNYLSYINSSKVDIPTSISGILSYNIDGLEQVFSPQNIKNITSKVFEKIVFNTNDKAPERVVAGQPVVKIINNFEWYVICILKSNKSEPLKVNDNIKIALNDGSNISATIKEIKDDGNGNAIITIFLTNNLEQFYNLRKADIKIIKRSYEGIKIPTKSLVLKDGKRGVMVVDKGVTEFKEVDIIGFDDKYAIVDPNDEVTDNKGLRHYDEIIVNPYFISEGMLLR